MIVPSCSVENQLLGNTASGSLVGSLRIGFEDHDLDPLGPQPIDHVLKLAFARRLISAAAAAGRVWNSLSSPVSSLKPKSRGRTMTTPSAVRARGKSRLQCSRRR